MQLMQLDVNGDARPPSMPAQDVSYNRLELLPPTLGDLPCLAAMNVVGNPLYSARAFPPSLAGLTSLVTLQISPGMREFVPPGIAPGKLIKVLSDDPIDAHSEDEYDDEEDAHNEDDDDADEEMP